MERGTGTRDDGREGKGSEGKRTGAREGRARVEEMEMTRRVRDWSFF